MEEVQKIAPALHLMTCFEIGSGELGAGWGETKENPQANIPGSTLLPVIFSCTYLALMWLN